MKNTHHGGRVERTLHYAQKNHHHSHWVIWTTHKKGQCGYYQGIDKKNLELQNTITHAELENKNNNAYYKTIYRTTNMALLLLGKNDQITVLMVSTT